MKLELRPAPSLSGSRGRRGRPGVAAARAQPGWEGSRPGHEREVITFLTASGLFRLPATVWPQVGPLRQRDPLPSAAEQGLCLAETFTVQATNGHDPSRRLQLLGFCRSARTLSDCVEEAALRAGGEVYRLDLDQRGLAQALRMCVGLPFLFGVPPAHEYLLEAIKSSGGIVHEVTRKWVL